MVIFNLIGIFKMYFIILIFIFLLKINILIFYIIYKF